MSVVTLIVAIAAALFAAWQAWEARRSRIDARAAQKASEGARDESLQLAREATAALRSQADEAKRGNDLDEQAQQPTVDLRIVPSWTQNEKLLANEGKRVALQVMVEALPGAKVWLPDDLPRDVGPGDSIPISYTRMNNADPRIRYSWDNGDGGGRQSAVANL